MSETTPSVWKREEQWVARVVGFSSQYNDSTWSANQVIGPPKVYPRHGDITGAWAQGNRADNEFLIVEFERSVYPEQIDIYETFNPGAVVRVAVRNSRAVASSVEHELFVPAHDNNAGWVTVWETATPHVEARSRIFSVPCRNLLGREINQIRLDVNCTAANNWCEIDSIKLTGHTSMNDTSYKELVAALKHLFTDQCLSDVVFELDDGEKLSSYRNVLRNRSIYFHQLFQDEATKRSETIRIPKISSRAFYQILHFVFTDQIEPVLTFEICLELMRKADEYFLGAIYDQAFEILKQSITKQNVLKIFTQTGLFAAPDDDEQILLPDVIDACVDFIQKNRRDVYLSEYIEQLSKEMLLQLIKLVQ